MVSRKSIAQEQLNLPLSVRKKLSKKYAAWALMPGVSSTIREAAAAKAEWILS